MTAKEYLGQIWHLEKRIRSLRDEKRKLEERAKGLGTFSTTEKVQTSSSKALEDTWAKVTQISLDINSNIQEQIELQEEVRKNINKMDNNDLSSLLRLRYISNRSWFYIAEQMSYSERHIRRLHGFALREFEKIMS